MLEFYYKYHKKFFKNKSSQLAEEIMSIFAAEEIKIVPTNELNIEAEYENILGKKLFIILNNLYFTLRKYKTSNLLLYKYLPEFRQEPLSKLLFADFFCGSGGLSQGLINAGFEVAFVNDHHTSSLETYYFNHNLPLSRFFNGDIKKLVEDFSQYKPLFKNVKVISGGPPCQGFSTANRQNFELEKNSKTKRFIEDERNVLYKYFVKLLGLIRPDFFIMENVKGMMRVEKQIEEDIYKETRQEYSFIPLDLDAQNFDIPQSRKRYILIGGKNVEFLESVRQNISLKKNKKSKYVLSDALFGLPAIVTNPIKLKINYESISHGFAIRKFNAPQNKFLRELNKDTNFPYILNHKSRYNNNNDLEIYRRLPPGANSLHESIYELNKYKNRDNIFKDKYYKLKPNEVSKTITSHMKQDCHMYIHPEQPRGLTPREAARIQTFPDNYLFRGSLNDWYKQIGNAVPVKLAEIIAKELMGYYR